MKKSSLALIVALAALIAAALSVSITLAVTGDDDIRQSSAPNAVNPAPDSRDDEQEEEAEPEEVVLRRSDFALKIKIKEKECFGSAGCVVVYQINPNYVGLEDASTGTWDITYKVTGGEDAIVNTMTLEDGSFSFDAEESVSTPSSGSVLKAKVMSVESTDYFE